MKEAFSKDASFSMATMKWRKEMAQETKSTLLISQAT